MSRKAIPPDPARRRGTHASPALGGSWTTSGERKALALVAGLFLLGLLVRWWRLSS